MKKFMKIKGFVTTQQITGEKQKSNIVIIIPFNGNKCNPDVIKEMVLATLFKHTKTNGKFGITYSVPVAYMGILDGEPIHLAKIGIEVNKKRRYKLIEEIKGKRFQNKFKRNLYARHIQDCVYDLDKYKLTDFIDTDNYADEYKFNIIEEF